MKIDTHIHCHYSADSVLGYQELCKKAIRNNYSVLAITEHYDLIDSEIMAYGLLPIKQYFEDIGSLRLQYPQLEIIAGLEIGEPHLIQDFASRLFSSYQPEYTIGSLHVTRKGLNVSLPIMGNVKSKQIREYYEEILEMVESGWFDTLGHLGVFKRAIRNSKNIDESESYSVIDEIFRVMIKKEICLEVNNSGYNSFFNNHIPEPSILLRYKKLGGKLITIGSDSHYIEHFDRFYNKTLDSILAVGFSGIYWKKNGVFCHT